MLKSRIDVTIEDCAVFKYHLYINGIDKPFPEAGIYAREPVYIAFSPRIIMLINITETAAITNFSVVSAFIKRMKGFGCQFALDDFGGGLSSFGYLKNLDVDYLKIDRIFVKDVVDDKIDLAMVKSINENGHVMSIKAIAEFVESDEIMEKLQELGVDYLQGYGVAPRKMWSQILMR